MAVCYITQLEIYPSNPQNDLLDIRRVDDAVNLLDDLNYIRSVIRAILGSDANRWNDVDFITPKNITEIWKRLAICCNRSTVSTLSTTTDPPIAEEYVINGMVPTENFVVGEAVFVHTFSQSVFFNETVLGMAYAEVAPSLTLNISGTNYTATPDDVEFIVFNKDNKVIAQFAFEKGGNTAQILKVGGDHEFFPGDIIKIVPITTEFYTLENVSFYMNFKTYEYGYEGKALNFSLYGYVSDVSSVLTRTFSSSTIEQISTNYTYKLAFQKTTNPFVIQQLNPGTVYVNKKPTVNTTIYIYKNSDVVGNILLTSGSNTGTITMNTLLTSFAVNDEFSLRLHSGTATPALTTTFDGLAFNLKVLYTNLNPKINTGYYGYVPGNLPDVTTVFSYVAKNKESFNFSNSIFAISNFITKIATIDVFKNNSKVGYVTFSPNARFGKSFVPEIQTLKNGDCLYFKTSDNDNIDVLKNLHILLFSDSVPAPEALED